MPSPSSPEEHCAQESSPEANWQTAMRAALTRRSVPPHHIRRLMDELHEHYLDLMEEHQTMDATTIARTLGEPQQLATLAAAEYRTRTFAGRHPIITFLVAPIPLAAGLIIAALAVVWAVASLVPETAFRDESQRTLAAIALPIISWTLRLAPFALLAFAFSRIAHRAGHNGRWPLAASLILALFAATFTVDYRLPTAEPNSGQFMLGFGVALTMIQATQFLVPMALAAWLARRNRWGSLT